MQKIKEITVFFPGESDKINSWSNVPFFFTENLIAKGIKINRVDISVSSKYDKLYNSTLCRVWRKIYPNTTWSYSRSFIHFQALRRRIKKAVKIYPNADLNVFIASYAFPLKSFGNIPSIALGDWTLEYTIDYFQKRKPDLLEKFAINRETRQIDAADMIVSLFPGRAKELQEKQHNRHIYYLGNVVNSLIVPDENEVLELKKSSNDILFIGRSKYKEGADVLIEAFIQLKKNNPDLNLHIIGLTDSDFTDLPKDVHCYGYLDKGNDIERELYYNLLKRAKVFVNTTPQWGTFSASLEAMHFYCPVIVYPYDEFINTFGNEMQASIFCNNNKEDLLAALNSVVNNTLYEEKCRIAHESVEDFKWEMYINKFLTTANAVLQDRI